ncbi:hypothetical protein J1N35_012244 [Gossypium stocksii]|uniref:Uncharacterized protein n=1 Tax=Gossypium stocksii TaxID=47602 RepID=A0A9D3W3Y5_9ROSI|nr:hypothetical protein J1N35_012244 [Gossypium stocksii]
MGDFSWTRVWVTCGERGLFYKPLGHIQTEIVAFPWSVQAGFVTWVRDLALLSSCGSLHAQSFGGAYPGYGKVTRILSRAEANFVPCTTEYEEMLQALYARGIEIPNFVYEFSILKGSYRLSDTSDGSFLIPFHVLEARFHLHLNLFFFHLLNDYQISLGPICNLRSDFEEMTSISREINEVMEATKTMNLRATLRDQRKTRRTGVSAVNVVITSEENMDSDRLERRCKKRVNHAKTSTMMVMPLLHLSRAHKVRLAKNLNSKKLWDIESKWRAPVLETVKRKLCTDESSESSHESELLTLNSSLQSFLVEASMISLGLEERIGKTEVVERELESNLKVFDE